MLRTLPLVLFLVACGEKAPPENAGSAPTSTPSTGKVAGAPGDSTSQSFARALVALTVKDFSASGASGATFKYTTLRFNADGTFSADGYVQIDDESMDCKESGPWSMDAAESATVAAVTWKVETTSCAGRDPGAETRAKIDLSDSDNPKFSFR